MPFSFCEFLDKLSYTHLISERFYLCTQKDHMNTYGNAHTHIHIQTLPLIGTKVGGAIWESGERRTEWSSRVDTV